MLDNLRHQQQCLLQRPLLQRLRARKGQEPTRLHQSRIGALQVGPSSPSFFKCQFSCHKVLQACQVIAEPGQVGRLATSTLMVHTDVLMCMMLHWRRAFRR